MSSDGNNKKKAHDGGAPETDAAADDAAVAAPEQESPSTMRGAIIPDQAVQREPGMISFKSPDHVVTMVVLHESIRDQKEIFMSTYMPEWNRKTVSAGHLRDRGLSEASEALLNAALNEMDEMRQKFRRERGVSGWVFHTLPEEMRLEKRGRLRLQQKDYIGALQDYSAALQCCQYTQRDPPCDDDHAYRGKYVHARVECFEGLLVDAPLNLEYLNGSITNAEAMFECTRACPTSVHALNQYNILGFLVKQTTQRKILEMKTNFSRPVFSQCDRRDLEKTVGRRLFEKISATPACIVAWTERYPAKTM